MSHQSHLRYEQGLLESLFFASRRYDEIASIVEPRHFASTTYAAVYAAICELCEQDVPPDPVTVTARLEAKHRTSPAEGWLKVVIDLQEGSNSAAIVQYAEAVSNSWRLREMASLAARMTAACNVESAEEVPRLLAHFQDALSDLEPGISAKLKEVKIGDAAQAVQDDVAERSLLAEDKRLPGMPTGYRRLDWFLHGWVPKRTYVLKADTGMGKSACALSWAYQAARRKEKRVVILSLEMDEDTIASRIIANAGSADAQRMRLAMMDEGEVSAMIAGVGRCKDVDEYLSIVFAPELNASALRRLVRRLARRPGPPLGLLVIDYVQLITGDRATRGGNREQEVAAVSAAITACAGTYDVAILALSQVNDEGKARESRKIEQDAHVVLRLQVAEGEEPTDERVIYDLLIQKNRHGRLTRPGDFAWTFLKTHQRFAVVDNRGDVVEYPRGGD